MYSRNNVYKISGMQEVMHHQSRRHILLAHAITGCDTVSALFSIGKKRALTVLENHSQCDMFDKFKKCDSSHDEIARVGENFLLHLYKCNKSTSLDKSRYILYTQKVSKMSSSFKLESLLPTSAAAKYHSYRTYFTIQKWLGNLGKLDPTDWGWECQENMLTPILTDRPVAPEQVLLIISCGCKQGCENRCRCCKTGMFCTTRCLSCTGQTCTNSCPPDGEDD